MRILLKESKLFKLEEEMLSPEQQYEEFLYKEDKVKSSFMSRNKILSWYNRLSEKYPSLKIRLMKDGDVLRAVAEMKNKNISESVKDGVVTCDNCGWNWELKDGGDDPYICHKCYHNNFSPENILGKRVMVYYNLHKRTFSVSYNNKVVIHADYVKLSSVEFRVRAGGKERVRKEKSKNVHAFVIGVLEDYCEHPCKELPSEQTDRVVTYDPYKYDSFVYKSSEEPIYFAKEVEMINKKNKLFVIQETTKK